MSPQEAANAFLVKLRALVQEIPGYAILTKERVAKLRPNAHLPAAFFNSVAVSMDALPELSQTAHLTGAEARYAVQFRDAFTAAADEMIMLAMGVKHTVVGVAGEVGVRCLRAYDFGKSLDRPADRESLIPYVADMKRTLGRSRPAKEKETTAPPAAPPSPAGTSPSPAGPVPITPAGGGGK